jgi:hypothetical protein
MKYLDLRPGDLIFTEPSDFIGRLIAKNQRIGYSHCGFIIDRRFCESEIRTGVHSSDIVGRLNGKNVTVLRPNYKFNIDLFSASAFWKIGCKYDWRGIIYQLIKEWTGRWINETAKIDNNSFYCSKYYSYCMSKASNKFGDYEQISLNDLFNDSDFNFIYKGVLI